MGATVLLLGAMRLVWYGFSGFSVLSSILLNWRSRLASLYSVSQQGMLVYFVTALSGALSKKGHTEAVNPYPANVENMVSS